MIAALAEARRRGLATIAFVGYDGGRIAAEGLADHVVVTRSQHIPRIQEAQASAYHVLLRAGCDERRIVHAKLRGVIGAMAMTGMRVFDRPRSGSSARTRRRGDRAAAVKGCSSRAARRRRAASSSCTGPTARSAARSSGCCPTSVRRQRLVRARSTGCVVWLGFDAVVAPALGLTERDWPTGRERAVFVADHLLYGFVLAEMRARPRE